MSPAEFRAARKQLSLTVNQMAALLEVRPIHVRKMELAESLPSHRRIMPVTAKLLHAISLVERIQDALGTAEEGDALVEVARNAHKAEQHFAALSKWLAKKAAEEEADYFNRHINFKPHNWPS